jgi:hypothetical protein
MAFAVLLLGFAVTDSSWAQTVSGVRAFGGGVAPLFNLVGSPGFYYTDNQGTQGSMYTFGSFESYSYLTPGGQAWSGAVMTFGPQLSIGLVQGVNQTGTPTVFVPPPRQLPPLPPAPEVDALTLDLIP